MKPFPGILQRSKKGYHPYVLNKEQKAWLRETYPVTENRLIAKAMGASWPSTYKLVKQLKLHKSKEGLQTIYERQRHQHSRMNRQARLSLLGGTQPEQCTNIRLKPYTKKQMHCRHRAVKLYGYIVYDGHYLRDNDPERYCIFYDSDTQRSKRFEDTCAKYGLTVKAYETDEDAHDDIQNKQL